MPLLALDEVPGEQRDCYSSGLQSGHHDAKHWDKYEAIFNDWLLKGGIREYYNMLRQWDSYKHNNFWLLWRICSIIVFIFIYYWIFRKVKVFCFLNMISADKVRCYLSFECKGESTFSLLKWMQCIAGCTLNEAFGTEVHYFTVMWRTGILRKSTTPLADEDR